MHGCLVPLEKHNRTHCSRWQELAAGSNVFIFFYIFVSFGTRTHTHTHSGTAGEMRWLAHRRQTLTEPPLLPGCTRLAWRGFAHYEVTRCRGMLPDSCRLFLTSETRLPGLFVPCSSKGKERAVFLLYFTSSLRGSESALQREAGRALT